MVADIPGGYKEGRRERRSCGDRWNIYGNYWEKDAHMWAEESVVNFSWSYVRGDRGCQRLEEDYNPCILDPVRCLTTIV